MDKLISFLNRIEELDIPDSNDNILNDRREDIINTALLYASDVLIDENGKNIWSNHDILEEVGFRVFVGEQDSSGWLSGCIQTNKGILIYS